MSENHEMDCGCGFRVAGTPAFVEEQYDKHLLRCRDTVATLGAAPEGAALIRRAIADVAGSNAALRARLQTAATDLMAAGYSSVEIADRLTSGESVE